MANDKTLFPTNVVYTTHDCTCEIASFRPRADICNIVWPKGFGRLFEVKGFLFEFYFLIVTCLIRVRFHDDIHNLSWLPRQFRCISARQGSLRACGPWVAVAGRDLAILQLQPDCIYLTDQAFDKVQKKKGFLTK